MISAELRLKAVRGMAKWRCHHSGIGYNQVKRLPLREQAIGAGSDALQVRKIERCQLKGAAIRRGILSHLCGGGFGFHQAPRRSHDVRAVRRKSPRRLNSDSRRRSGNEHPFSTQVDPLQDIVCS
jgi:hypothetical protein